MLDIKYVAGLFDGEGCIYLRKQKRVNSPLPSWCLIATVAMVHKPIIRMLHAQFGGTFSLRKPYNENERNAFVVVWAAKNAKRFLEQVLPHLILKKEEAELGLKFQNELSSLGTRFWHRASQVQIDALQAEREAIFLKLKALKRVQYSFERDVGEFGENPDRATPSQAENNLFSGVCNEQVPTAKAKICSELHGNMQSAAEMTAPEVKH